MKRIVILIIAFWATSGLVQAQTESDSIIRVKKRPTAYYYYHGESKSFKELREIMINDPVAYTEMTYAREYEIRSLFADISGAACIGVALLYNHIGGNSPTPLTVTKIRAFAIAGGILLIDGVVRFIQSDRKGRRAVEIYNSHLGQTSFWNTHEVKVGFVNGGVSLAFCF